MHLITIASGPYVNWIPSLIENRNNYCNKHGYTWQITSDVLPGVHAAFAKIGAILDAFKAGHEQVFWIDADAAITNFEFNIKGLAQAPFVVSRCRTHPICTGVFIAQDHPVIIDFLERMWAEREVHQRPPWEQGVIIRRWNEIAHHAIILEKRKLNSSSRDWQFGDFIYHAIGTRNPNRKWRQLRRWLQPRGISPASSSSQSSRAPC